MQKPESPGLPRAWAWTGAAGLAAGAALAAWAWTDPGLAAAWWALAALCGAR